MKVYVFDLLAYSREIIHGAPLRPRGVARIAGAPCRARAAGGRGPGLTARPEFHIDMREPEVVKGFASRCEPEAAIERDQMGLGGKHHL